MNSNPQHYLAHHTRLKKGRLFLKEFHGDNGLSLSRAFHSLDHSEVLHFAQIKNIIAVTTK